MICLDIVKRFLRKDASERLLLIISKISSVLVLVLSVILSNVIDLNLKSLLIIQSNLLLQSVPTYLLGLYTKNINTEALCAGILTGILVVIGIIASPQQHPLGVDPGIYGIFANIAAVFIVQMFLQFYMKKFVIGSDNLVEHIVLVEDKPTLDIQTM